MVLIVDNTSEKELYLHLNANGITCNKVSGIFPQRSLYGVLIEISSGNGILSNVHIFF